MRVCVCLLQVVQNRKYLNNQATIYQSDLMGFIHLYKRLYMPIIALIKLVLGALWWYLSVVNMRTTRQSRSVSHQIPTQPGKISSN